jgi:hypothetical protein
MVTEGNPMITSAQCKNFLDECHVLGTDPDISVQRATSVMSICRALIQLNAQLAHYDMVVEAEGKVSDRKFNW